jgi:hypothetical protein
VIVRGLKIAAVAAVLVVLGIAGTWASRQLFTGDERAMAVTGTIEALQVGLPVLLPNLWPLVVFGAFVFSASILRFRKQLD